MSPMYAFYGSPLREDDGNKVLRSSFVTLA